MTHHTEEHDVVGGGGGPAGDKRRERLVSMCDDPDVQELTWQAYTNKELARAKPAAQVRIFFKDMAHPLGSVSPTRA